jgi:DNA-binding winged helix-turn-helix (wHTH) protein/Tfp pilus assembly protein PilF
MKSTYRFGPFVLDRSAYQLSGKKGAAVTLSPKAMDLLFLLADRPGVLFTKDDIFKTLWPDVNVTDNALTQVISELRQALGDKPNAPVYIETVARRGYRFIATVEASGEVSAAKSAAAPAVPSVAELGSEHMTQLQSAIATALMSGLRITLTAAPSQPVTTRETASFDAYRLTTEAQMKLETLEPQAISAAIAEFTRAIALDPTYTPAHIGLAHARFWVFQATRARNRPDRNELDAAIAHGERAVELDPGLAEAHAALAFFLSCTDRVDAALANGRLAVSMEPGNWRHHFRLGVAAWGTERLDCLAIVMTQFPALTHAHFSAAMVHVARGDFDAALGVLARGIESGGKHPSRRLPGRGLHWLRGLILMRQGRVDDARAAFDAELAADGGDLYADEFAMDALSAHGFSRLATNEPVIAADMFEQALTRVPDHAKSWLGLADARQRLGDTAGAAAARARAEQATRDLAKHGRAPEAALATALAHLIDRDVNDACHVLNKLLDTAPPGVAGWTLPVEPWLAAHAQDPRFKAVAEKLAARAK